MKKDTRTMEIDIVYLWVDGNDPVWQALRLERLFKEVI